MPIAKAIDPNYQYSVHSEDSPHVEPAAKIPYSVSVSERSEDDFTDDPLKAYQKQQREHRRRKQRVQAAPDSCQGFFEWIKVICKDVAENDAFQLFILVCITINSMMLGMVTFPMIKDDPTLSKVFNTADMIFLVIFTVDIAMHLLAEGTYYFTNGWSVFDFLIVVISWLSVSFTGLYAFRVFRAFRLITRVESMRNVVVVLFHVVPAISAICLLLTVIMYIYAVLCTDLFKDFYPGIMSGDYFGRLDMAFFTLFQFICMDEWSSIAYEIVEESNWYWIIFISFIVMTAFVVVNLMIAVICDAVGILRKAEEALLRGDNGEPELDDDDDDDDSDDQESPLRKKIREMEELLDEMEISQERMAETIKYLSLALLSRGRGQRN